MKNIKASGALATIALAAIFTQSTEGQKINIKTDKVSDNLKEDFGLVLQERDNHVTLFKGLASMSRHIKVNGMDLQVDTSALLAAVNISDKDSTDQTKPSLSEAAQSFDDTYLNCYSNCYSNCHGACHGSRSWR